MVAEAAKAITISQNSSGLWLNPMWGDFFMLVESSS